jgi:hypothetical protein
MNFRFRPARNNAICGLKRQSSHSTFDWLVAAFGVRHFPLLELNRDDNVSYWIKVSTWSLSVVFFRSRGGW